MSKPKPLIARKELISMVRRVLGSEVPVDVLEEVAPDIVNAMAHGEPAPKYAEMLVQKVVRLAIDTKKSNQWAVELIFDRIEGRAAVGAATDDKAREIDEKLESVTRDHLNDLAEKFAKLAPGSEDGAGGSAEKLLGLPSNRPEDSD